jgi:DNA-binding IscR family transcriptional regulator
MREDEILKKCVLGLKQCSETKSCPMHHQYKLIKPQLVKMFETKTIKDLADELKKVEFYQQ